MKTHNMKKFRPKLTLTACMLLPLVSHAQQVVSDTLKGAAASLQWQSFNGACLTAGNNTGTIPACVGLPYYKTVPQIGGTTGTLPDAVGQGALRLTNGTMTLNSEGNNQTGAVVSTAPFSSSQGLQVTFSSVTYGGNGYDGNSNGKRGSDGMTFFLTDAAQEPSVGGIGGSLGYSCSNGNSTKDKSGNFIGYDGVRGGYIGVGIDEYGNFANAYDTTATGSSNGLSPSTISVRGGGNVNWYSLSKNYPALYPSSTSPADQVTAVQTTCRTGTLYNASDKTQTITVDGKKTEDSKKTETIASKGSSSIPILDYPFLASSTLFTPDGVRVAISNQQEVSSPTRGQAKPITYALSITQAGILNMSYSYNGGVTIPVITNKSITASNGPVPDKFRFGFSAGTGYGTNVHEITCFKAAALTAASTSAGVNIQQSSRVEAGTQFYLSYYQPTNWWGQLTATSLLVDTATNSVVFKKNANWDASCVLTGGACIATGTTDPSQPAQAPFYRMLLAWDGNTGVPFQFNKLSASQQDALGNREHINYLRGRRDREISAQNPDGMRARTGVLGDIISSSPVWVGAPAFPYTGSWKDGLNSAVRAPESTSYTNYASTNATRTHVVYSGANDGFMHGFRAGANKADKTFDSTTNDGRELIGYMPTAVSAIIRNPKIATLDFTSPQYTHAAFVDAAPGTGDLYYAGAWHTWLVSGIGGGGNPDGPINDNTSTARGGSLFALDITSSLSFYQSNATNLVIGDWGPDNLKCGPLLQDCGTNLGNTYGTPIVRRLHDGNWAVIFGNGYNSKTGTAGIYIMTVKQSDGSKTFRFLDTGYGPSKDPSQGSSKNGMAYVASADLDGDHITDYIYAGDLYGNLWRFDFTASDASKWAASSSPLFSTPVGQPISTNVTVSSVLSKTGPSRVVVGFGTGQRLPQTQTSAAIYATAPDQSLYGIWDWNMDAWNAISSTRYVSLPTPQTVSKNVLQVQTAINVAGGSDPISGYRTVTNTPICWAGLSNCASGKNVQFGWQLALPNKSEQVIYSPVTTNGFFVVSTVIPATSNTDANTLTCDNQPASGYTMAVAIDSGSSTATSFFANAANSPVTANGLVISGIGLSGTGTPSFVSAGKKLNLITQTASGVGRIIEVNPSANGIGKRVTWIKLR